jgi:hypothetical protein
MTRPQLVVKVVAAAFVATMLASGLAIQRESTPTHDLWMLPLPLGYEVDYQRSRGDGDWALFWQDPGGASTPLVRGTSDRYAGPVSRL